MVLMKKSFKEFKRTQEGRLLESMAPLWKKRPLEVEAFKWTGDRYQEHDPDWIVEAIIMGIVTFEVDDNLNPLLLIETQHGVIRANSGDYIIRGINGEIYPCSEEIFLNTYDKVLHN